MIAESSTEALATGTLLLGGLAQTKTGTLITGQDLAAGTVLGRITASGKLTTAVKAAGDGSNTPVGVLIHAVDATAADKDCQLYTGGDLDATMLTWGAGYTDADKAGAFDGTPIKLVTPA